MIITCPSCAARYKVRDDLIPSSGKRIKCKKCAALFRAYPDKKAVLEKPSPKPEAPAAPAAPKAASSQATVMVDQAKITNFLQQMPEGAEKKSEPAKPPTAASPTKPSHATVQIDRTKIDAFLQTKVEGAGGDYEPNTTLEVSREELDQFLNKPKPKPTPAPDFEGPGRVVGSEDLSPKAKIDESRYQDLQRALGAQFEDPAATKKTVEMPPQIALKPKATPDPLFDDTDKEIQAPADPDLERTDPGLETPDFDSQGVSFDDDSWSNSFEKPSFPSDEELGLTEEPDNDMLENSSTTEDVSFEDEAEDFLPESSEDDFLTDSDTDVPITQEPALDPAPAGASASTTPSLLFSVKVEDTEYPNKSLEALDRWIHEGRLLETDMVAYSGTSHFQKAYDIPEIAAIFDRYFGQSGEQETHQPEAKKGFFARLFSSFGKKK